MKLNIGKIIYELRKRDGITQDKLAQSLGVSVAAVSKWENGNTYPDITVLPAIARYFKITVDELMGYEELCSEEELQQLITTSKELVEQGQFNEVITLCEDYIRQYPTNLEVKFVVATFLNLNKTRIVENEEKYRGLINYIVQLFEEASKSEDREIKDGAYAMLSDIYRHDKQYDKAIATLSQLPRLKFEPDGILASILLEQGKSKQANQLATSVIMKSWSNLMNAIGIIVRECQQNKDYVSALEILDMRSKLMDVMELDVVSRLENEMEYLKIYAKQQKSKAVLQQLEKLIKEIEKVKNQQEESEKQVTVSTIDLGMDALREMVFGYVQYLKEDESLAFIRGGKEIDTLIKDLERTV